MNRLKKNWGQACNLQFAIADIRLRNANHKSQARPQFFSSWLSCFIILLFVSCSCQNTETSMNKENKANTTIFSGLSMTMEYKVIVGQLLERDQTDVIRDIITNTFHEIDSVYNKWNPDSEISRLNGLKAHVEVRLSPNLEKFLKETDFIVQLSDGRFDPTIEPLQQLWKSKLKLGQTPSQNELKEIASAVGWDKIHFSEGKFFKDDDRTQIDLGGIAKGLCIDLIAQRIADAGYKNVFVEWGGEIRAMGMHPDSRPWTVYISGLGDSNPDHAIDKVYLKNQAIATSGDYLQNWTIRENGNISENQETTTYFHIFDPIKLKPLKSTRDSIASVSVVAPTCALADGLATAAMLFTSVEEAEAWSEKMKEKYPEISFWVVSRSMQP